VPGQRINEEALYGDLTGITEFDFINNYEISAVFVESNSYNLFEQQLSSVLEQKQRGNLRSIEQIDRYLGNILYEFGYQNIKPTLDRYLKKCSENICDVQAPSWEGLFIQTKRARIEKKYPWVFFLKRKKTSMPNLESAREYVNAELRNRFLKGIVSIIENLKKYFDQKIQERIEITIKQEYIDKVSVLWGTEYEGLIKRLMLENKKIILFRQLKDSACEVKLENLTEFNKESSGIVVQSVDIALFNAEETQMLTDRLKVDFQTQFVDLLIESPEDDTVLRVSRYCLIDEVDQVHTLKRIIHEINTSYDDNGKVDQMYLAVESPHDLLRSPIRSKMTSYKITNENLANLLLYAFCLNILRINKKGYSISHEGDVIDYSSLEEMQAIISYKQEEDIRRRFINKFFESPANVLDKLNSLLNSSETKKTISNKALSDLYKSQVRLLANYTRNLSERLTNLREKYA
jgi:hypothetical protein